MQDEKNMDLRPVKLALEVGLANEIKRPIYKASGRL
jgi:hypothetical protein